MQSPSGMLHDGKCYMQISIFIKKVKNDFENVIIINMSPICLEMSPILSESCFTDIKRTKKI